MALTVEEQTRMDNITKDNQSLREQLAAERNNTYEANSKATAYRMQLDYAERKIEAQEKKIGSLIASLENVSGAILQALSKK